MSEYKRVTKVAIFRDNYIDRLESHINDFTRNRDNIVDIKFTSCSDDGIDYHTALVIYEVTELCQ